MVDHRKFEKVKDVDTLRRLFEAEKQKAASVLEVRLVEAAARNALKRLQGEGKA